ncbi:MAG: CRTAC1 family protein [Halosimplex sp.]
MARRIGVDVVVVLVVVLLGYSLYPVAAGAVFAPQPGVDATGNGTADVAFEDTEPLAFRNVTERVGLEYRYTAEYRGSRSMISNAGVYTADYDRDGYTDVLAVGGDRPVLFDNDGERFERSSAFPDLNRSFRAALFVDYDTDGWTDLLLLPMHAQPVFLENRGGRFVERDVGLNRTLSVPTGASAADFDGNGCPDLFVTQNGDWTGDRPAGLRNYSVPEGSDNGSPNLLFRGDCASFEEVSREAGITGHHWSLASSAVDLTGDGRPDLHVANDFGYDVFYENVGDGFERRRLGPRTNRNGMSSEVADLTGDGRLDVFVTNVYFPEVLQEAVDTTMQIRGEGNNLLVNRGDGTFDEGAAVYGVRRGGWGWGAVAADFTNDGRVDLFHTTRDIYLQKYRRTMRDAEVDYLQSQFDFFAYPAAWRHTDDGLEPVDAAASGFDVTNGRGVAQLDYDNDGRVDLLVADAGGRYVLYENTGTDGTALRVDVRGTDTHPALGARVTVESGDLSRIEARDAKSDFLSQDTRVLHFGTGNRTSADVTVRWADGTEHVFPDVPTGHTVTVFPNGTARTTAFDRAG